MTIRSKDYLKDQFYAGAQPPNTLWYDLIDSLVTLPILSVIDYGAVGDGVTDDTAAIQAAIDAATAVGRQVFLPRGSYKITSTLNINTKRGLRLCGDMVGYAAAGADLMTRLVWAGGSSDDLLYIFNSQDIEVDHLLIDGDSNTTLRAIFADSNNTQVTKRIHLHHVTILRCNIGMQFAAVTGATEYQVDSLTIDNFSISEMVGSNSAGLVFQSQNTDRVKVSQGEISGGVYGIKINKGGFMRFADVGGGLLTDFIYIDGAHGALVFEACQAESITNWLYVTNLVSVPGGPLSLIGCIVDGTISINNRRTITSIGCLYNANVDLVANDVDWISLNDYFSGSYGILRTGSNEHLFRLNHAGLSIDADGVAINRLLSASKTWDPGTIAGGAYASTTLACTGAAAGDVCIGSHTTVNAAGLILFCTIASANLLNITLYNCTGVSATPGSGTLKVDVIKH